MDGDRLEALLGGDELAWLRDRVRQRLESGRAAVGTVTLRGPTPAQRAAVDRLLGRRPSSGAQVTVSLDAVDRRLRSAGICDGWIAAVEALDGPIVDQAALRLATEAAWRAVDALLPDGEAWQRTYADDLRRTGLLRRLGRSPEDAEQLLRDAQRVLDALPVKATPLARLAAEVLGDSHALDDDQPVATLVLKALQHGYLPEDERGSLPSGVERRALWAAAGVLLDEFAAPVLVWNLPARGTGPVDVTLQVHAAAGEPVRLTLGQLLRHPPDLGDLAGRTVWSCENPAVVSVAAEQLGRQGGPLLCTDGSPSAAVQSLARLLREAGATLAHHGDLDLGGLRITSLMVQRFDARPWRMDEASYLAAPAGPRLRRSVPAVPWAPGLAEAMNQRGVAVHEEQAIADLLADLASAG